MFWRMGFQQNSPVDAILDREHFELEELLDEEDLLQECKAINRKLISYLSTKEVVSKLIAYSTTEPPPDADSKIRLKFPHVAAAVLSADMQVLYDCIYENENLTEQLYKFLDGEGPENAVLAGYFCKIVSSLLTRKPSETLAVFRTRDVLGSCLRHIKTYSMVEIILRLVLEVEDTTAQRPQSEVEWVMQYPLMLKLLEKLDPSCSAQEHTNVASCLSGILKDAPRFTPTSFASQLASTQGVKTLLDNVFAGSSSALMAGLTVLVELLKINPAATASGPNPLVTQVLARLGDFVVLLQRPPAMEPITNTAETLDPPLGSNRLMVVEVLLTMLTMNNDAIDRAMVEQDVVFACLALVLRYKWNNLLHNLMEKMVSQIMCSPSPHLRLSLLANNRLVEWLLQANKVNDECVRTIGTRVGFAAQLLLMANAVIAAAESDPNVAELLKHPEWESFVQNDVLPRNELERRQLGGHKPLGNGGPQGMGGMGMGGGGGGKDTYASSGLGDLEEMRSVQEQQNNENNNRNILNTDVDHDIGSGSTSNSGGRGGGGGGDNDEEGGGEWRPRQSWDSEEASSTPPRASGGDMNMAERGGNSSGEDTEMPTPDSD